MKMQNKEKSRKFTEKEEETTGERLKRKEKIGKRRKEKEEEETGRSGEVKRKRERERAWIIIVGYMKGKKIVRMKERLV